MKRSLLLLLILIITKVYAQEKFFLDEYLEPADQKEAKFYAITTPENGKFRNMIYYMSGKFFTENISYRKGIFEFYAEGPIKTFHENGQIHHLGEYRDPHLVGKYQVFLSDGRKAIDSEFSNGKETGTHHIYQKSSNPDSPFEADRMITLKDGITTNEIIFDENPQGIRIERDFQQKEYGHYPKEERFYDKNGKLISKLNTSLDGSFQGTKVNYFYEPMQVFSVQTFPSKTFDHTRAEEETIYYRNGKIRTQTKTLPKTKTEIHYSKDGKKIAEMFWKSKNFDYSHFPINGKTLEYHDDHETVKSSTEYKNEIRLEEKEFNEKGQLRKTNQYTENGLKEVSILDDDGKEISTIKFKDGRAWEGTHITNYAEVKYVDGKIIFMRIYAANDGSYEITEKNQVKVFETKLLDQIYDTTIWTKNGEKLTSYQKSVSDQLFTAEIISYENGKPKHRATVKNGKLISGSFRVFHNGENQLWIADKDAVRIQTFVDGEIVKEEKHQLGQYPYYETTIKDSLLFNRYPYNDYTASIVR